MNVQLLRDSFEALKPYAKEMTAHFYRNLFGRHPEAKAMFFRMEQSQQQAALARALTFIVENVDRPEALTPYLHQMGRRHVEYGAKPEHYGWVAESMLATLRYFFEETWTPELEETWTTALTAVATAMLSVAEAAPAAPAASPEPVPAPVPALTLAEEFQRSVQRAVQDSLLRALRDPRVQEEVRKVAGAQAQKLLMQALQEELQQLKKELQPRAAA